MHRSSRSSASSTSWGGPPGTERSTIRSQSTTTARHRRFELRPRQVQRPPRVTKARTVRVRAAYRVPGRCAERVETVGSDFPRDRVPFEPIRYTSDVFPTERADTDYSPTGKTHRTTGAAGRSRSRYHPRPRPRHRADLMGFNAMGWMAIAIALVVVLLVWPF